MPLYQKFDPETSIFAWNTDALYSSSLSAHVDTSVSVIRMELPDAISFSRVDVPVSVSLATSATSNTAAMNVEATMVIYSRSGSTLTPLVGQLSTTTYTWASSTGVFSSLTGPRILSFNLATRLSAGEYYVAWALSTRSTSSIGANTTALRGTISPIFGTRYTVLPWALMSAATQATVNQLMPGQGMYSISISNTTMTLQFSAMTMTGATPIRANNIIMLRNIP